MQFIDHAMSRPINKPNDVAIAVLIVSLSANVTAVRPALAGTFTSRLSDSLPSLQLNSVEIEMLVGLVHPERPTVFGSVPNVIVLD